MRERERDALVLVLALAAGAVDAWSYFGVGHVFTANLTGNTVFLGIAIAGLKREEILKPALAIFSYAIGVVIGAWMSGEVDEKRLWPRRVSFALACEGLLLAATALLWARWYPLHGSFAPRILIAIAAIALGMQSSAMQTLKIPGIVTTYITGTWTTLMSGISRLLWGKGHKQSEKSKWEERLLMQAAVVVVYCMAAALTGWMLHGWPRGAPLIPMTAVLCTAGYSAARGERADR